MSRAWNNVAALGTGLIMGACGGQAHTRGNAGGDGPTGSAETDADGSPGRGGSNSVSVEPEAPLPPGPVPEAGCSDGIVNGAESDVDCGGAACGTCFEGAACRVGLDCFSRSCSGSTCQAPTCSDGVQNGDEMGVDCNGSCSSNCPVVLEPCDCPSSDALHSIGCGDIDLWRAFLSGDGSTLVYEYAGAVYRFTTLTGLEPLFADAEPSFGDAEVRGLSADGQTLLIQRATSETFLWSSGQPLRPLPHAWPLALSDDGRVVLFLVSSDPRASEIWADGRSVAVGVPSTTTGAFNALALSGNGAVVVGYHDASDEVSGYDLPFRWTEATGLELLGPFPAAARNGWAVVTSRDGSVAAGWTSTADGQAASIYRWTSEAGLVEIAPATLLDGLGILPPLLSDDGSVVVGTLNAGANTVQAFRWTQAEGPVLFAEVSGAQTHARLASADAGVIIGEELTSGQAYSLPFVWSTSRGYRHLTSALAEAGADLEGWELSSPHALSADGRVMVGMATCAGKQAAYRAVLPE